MFGYDQEKASWQARHKKQNTQIIDYVCVTLIYFGVFILLSGIKINIFGAIHLHLGWLAAIAIVALYFLCNNMQLAGGVAVEFFILNLIAGMLSSPTFTFVSFMLALVCLGGGVAGHYIAYTMEDATPDLQKLPMSLLAAPMIIMSDVMDMVGMGEKKPAAPKPAADPKPKEEKKDEPSDPS